MLKMAGSLELAAYESYDMTDVSFFLKIPHRECLVLFERSVTFMRQRHLVSIFWCQIWPVLCQNGSKWPLLDVKMAVFNYHLANPIYDQLIITVRAMIQQLSSGLPGHMVYCEPWRILRTDVYNMLWLKIIIYDYDMIILGITWKKYKSLILRLRVTV